MTMITKPFLALVAAATLSAQTAPAPDAPLAPSGQWTVSGDESLCLLAREFGVGDAKLTFGIRPSPTADDAQIVLVRPRGGSATAQRSDIVVTFVPSGATISANGEDFRVADAKQRITRFYVHKDMLEQLAASKEIAFAVGKEPPVRLALRSAAAALKTLDLCEDRLMQHWGFDPVVQHSLSRPPEPLRPLDSLITNYPTAALKSGATGIVRVRWTVDITGRATNCVVIMSSGHPSLDKNTCDRIAARARYQPALDKDGKPVAALKSGTFVFLLG